MKKLVIIMALISVCLGKAIAQQSENLSRNVLATIPENEAIEYGEFQAELMKSADFKTSSEVYWFSYLYSVTNKYTNKCNIVVHGNPLFMNRNMRVRTFRLGPSLEKSIFILKNMDQEANDIGYNKELVRAYGVPQQICDSILDLNDDGFVFMQAGHSYYSPYQLSRDQQVAKVPVSWLVRKTFEKDVTSFPPEKAAAFARLQDGAVYYESFKGDYYYLYRDQYMPYTVLVVNNKTVELFDVYDENNFDLRFSYNGQHWMAVGKKCYWVDGVIRSVDGFTITGFVVTNDGHYCYKAYKDGAAEEGEVVVVDGNVVRRNAKVCYFGMNAEGKLKFRFINNERYLQYEDGNITDVTTDLYSVYYPGNSMNGREIVVKSNDGLHKLVYQKDRPSVMIDGVEVANTAPCFAVFDSRNNTFIWNAIEKQETKTELVLYKYHVVNHFFKNLFK